MTSIWLANAVKPVLFGNFLRLLTRSKVYVYDAFCIAFESIMALPL